MVIAFLERSASLLSCAMRVPGRLLTSFDSTSVTPNSCLSASAAEIEDSNRAWSSASSFAPLLLRCRLAILFFFCFYKSLSRFCACATTLSTKTSAGQLCVRGKDLASIEQQTKVPRTTQFMFLRANLLEPKRGDMNQAADQSDACLDGAPQHAYNVLFRTPYRLLTPLASYPLEQGGAAATLEVILTIVPHAIT